ncbi:MAG: hypothetical protein QXI91_04355 [Candidatus Bathyarchaeia archaeon]
MKAKPLTISLLVIMLISTFASMVKADGTVKVAVYWETANIDSSELAIINNALAEVESRFQNKLEHSIDLEVVGSWKSRKDTKDYRTLITEAIRQTNGIYTTLFDNYGYFFTWKFHRKGYTAGIYIVEQDLVDEYGNLLGGAGSSVLRAGIVDYNPHGKWKPFERLCGIIQHELSHIFGIPTNCEENWCVMNGPDGDSCYMPYEQWFLIWKTDEKWATDWGSNCKQTLLETYAGCARTGIDVSSFGNCWKAEDLTIAVTIWTEEWRYWNLTQRRLKLAVYVHVPNLSCESKVLPYFAPGWAHPTTTITTIVSKIED